jgi:hypothetical protein
MLKKIKIIKKMSQIVKTPLASLVKNRTISSISKLHFNTNGYPFVTMLTKDSKAQNLYFGIKSSQIIGGNYGEGDTIIKELINADIVQTENAQGEIRYKLSLPGESNYSSETEMMNAFGLEIETPVDFDMNLFVSQFEGKPSIVAGV